jgi:hypothetical protein
MDPVIKQSFSEVQLLESGKAMRGEPNDFLGVSVATLSGSAESMEAKAPWAIAKRVA